MRNRFFLPTVSVVVRWFQIGVGRTDQGGNVHNFNEHDFEVRLAAPLRRFMRNMSSEVKSVVIVSNADTRFDLGEFADEHGETPTTRAIRRTFQDEVASGFIRTVVDPLWGNNAGSAHALNTGWHLARDRDAPTHILSWNPELQMTGGIVVRMLSHMERHSLDFVGAYRQRHWLMYQWQIAQNTACLYPHDTLEAAEGFSPENCDGNSGEMITVPSIGKTVLAGMDDFDLALRLAKQSGKLPRWGMVGRANPFPWDVDFTPDSERAKLLQAKVARQPIVMERWVRRHFPDERYYNFMDGYFANRHED